MKTTGDSDLEGQANAGLPGEIEPQAVRDALEKVLASDAFGKAERPARFLRHLVETALQGDTHLLKESVLGTDVFGRSATWDPRLDPVVRQEAARLRKRLAKFYETNGGGEEIRIELPVGGYVPIFRHKPSSPEPAALQPAAAQPAAVETAPAQPPVETPPPPPPVVSPAPARRPIDWVAALGALAGLGCLVAGFVAWRAAGQRVTLSSIAVLPFVNLTAEPANQYFADGLTDEITDSLSRLKNLRVIARSSSFQFKGKSPDLRDVGQRLNVGQRSRRQH